MQSFNKWKKTFVAMLALNLSITPVVASTSPGGSGPEFNCDGEQLVVASVEEAPKYKPPRLGAPKTRVGGGTRGGQDGVPTVELLAPASTGLTTQPSPTLFWHLSENYTGTFEFVVMESDGLEPEPLFRTQAQQTLCAGFHPFSLQNHEVELQEGVTYQWSVAIVRDVNKRSHDIVGQATLERIKEPAKERVTASANIKRTAKELASQGLWYDAIEAIAPSIRTPVNQRDIQTLMRQVGLGVVER